VSETEPNDATPFLPERTTLDSDLAPLVTATIHPSAIIRAPDDETRAQEREAFARDLGIVVEALRRP
jgi:hypothetical protein